MKQAVLIVSLMIVFPLFGRPDREAPAVEDAGRRESRPLPRDPEPKEWLSRSRHQIVVGDQTVEYEADAGTIILRDDKGEARATIFHVAYRKIDADPATRPVMFCFNGGPGSSSVWLHLGAFGPRKVKLDTFGRAGAPPWNLEDNRSSLLDVADLVFIDPVSTGFSRPAEGVNKKEFHGYNEDIESVGEFIRLWTTRNNRWKSPKYLAGESYGTTRAAGLAGHLQSRHGMGLNGVVLVSAVLDFQTISASSGNDLPYPLYLPSYTATAYHHEALDEESMLKPLDELLKEVESFCLNEYSRALTLGDRLAGDELEMIIDRLVMYTGLERDVIVENNLRVRQHVFSRELLSGDKRIVGRFDGRYAGPLVPGRRGMGDPSYDAVLGPFASTLNGYLREELKVDREQVYEILTGKVHPWNFDNFGQKYVRSADTLRDAMVANPHLKVLLVSGRTDLATPYFAADHVMAHLGLPEDRRRNITTKYYEAGHMMYLYAPDLAKLKRDVASFVSAR